MVSEEERDETGKKIRSDIDKGVLTITSLIDDFNHIKRFLELLEQPDCPILVGYSHPDGKWKYVNKRFADEMEMTKEEMYEVPWLKMIAESDRDRVHVDFVEALQSHGNFLNYTVNYISKSKRTFPITWHTSIVHPGDDKLTICIGIIANASTH